MKIYYKILTCLCFVSLLSGCAQRIENSKLAPEVLAKPSSVLITHISNIEKPDFYTGGRQGILDIAVNQMRGHNIKETLQTIDAKPILIEDYYQPFTDSLSSKSFKVIKAPASILPQDLKEAADGNIKYAPYDFKDFKKKYNVDYALILDGGFGIWRDHYSFIPRGAPLGVATVKIYMVELKTNSIVGYYEINFSNSIDGKWDAPPNYTNLKESSKEALSLALKKAHSYFFKVSNPS
ncbi:hypothetical protein [Candidatus Odyssella acanthamoebae]|uniref:Lipoprotein n=1 Tax=Candidatus Odyssella acanthamoebae TaxID=91604 RepID=A0A077AZ56_9PROT|nr:hypothetical protein [Candidatus Paracaedibacter acanthamoebae]AIK96918.1 hypothetical protein ID47_09545 [Candidatus Paracaedibacter acanthamoebae]